MRGGVGVVGRVEKREEKKKKKANTRKLSRELYF